MTTSTSSDPAVKSQPAEAPTPAAAGAPEPAPTPSHQPSDGLGPVGRVRTAVDGLPAYLPGKAAEQAEDEHNITGAIKLASNESPYPPSPAVVAAVSDAARASNRYCDHRAAELREAIADWLGDGVEASMVTVGAGSVALLYQLATAYIDQGDEVVTPWVSFEAYPIITQTMGGTLVRVPLRADWAFDMDAVAAAVTERTKLVTLATPNNPTGTAVSTAHVARLAESIPDDVVIVVDEAYREFADPALGDPIVDLLPRFRNVLVTRTFSKAYGLAGLRVGYAIGDPECVSAVDKCLIAFNVNGLAQAAALAALGAAATNEMRANVVSLRRERDRVAAELADAGWEIPDAQANFVWLPARERTDGLYLGLERRGVVTRPFSGLGIRATIGTPAENDRFLTTLAEATGPESTPRPC